MKRLEQVPTGVPGFDRILAGGLLGGGLHLIAGPPGTGKTILAHQIGARYAASGERVLYLTVLVESHETLLFQATRLEFFDPSWVGRLFYYASLYSALAEGGPSGANREIHRLIREHRPALVILDGLHVIQSTAASALEHTRFMNELQALGALSGQTTLAVMNSEAEKATGGEFAMVDAIFRLDRERSDRRVIRTIEVDKLRGTAHLTGVNVFTITGAGIRIYPRLEGIVARDGIRPQMPSSRQLSTGISTLDAMMGGGVSAASTTLVAGVPGAGKTLTGLSFTAATADSEPGLFVGFHETPDRIIAKAERIGIPLGEAVESGRIHILWKPSFELVADALAEEIVDLVTDHAIQRVTIDGLDDFCRMSDAVDRGSALLNALTDLLRSRGTTLFLTQELKTIFGRDFRLPRDSLSASVDNILLLRYVEIRARLRRLVSLLKMREHGYDTRIREFEVSESGIVVGEPLDEAEAVMSGFGRLVTPHDESDQ